jgi:hypothetical protein
MKQNFVTTKTFYKIVKEMQDEKKLEKSCVKKLA